MPSGEPAVQASYMKNMVVGLERLGAQGEAVRASDPELFAAIEETWRTSWMPIVWNVRLVRAFEHAFGPTRAIEMLAACVHGQFDTPLWKTFVESARRLLGVDPGSLMRWFPTAMLVVFRNCGRWSTESTGASDAVLEVRGLPADLASNRSWIQSIAAGGHALFLLCATRGEVRLVEHDAVAGRARFALHWEARREAAPAQVASGSA